MKSFDELFNLDISSKTKKNKQNDGLDYLSWLDCFLILKEFGMTPEYGVEKIKELPVSGQIIVKVWVKIGDDVKYITYTDARSRDFEFIKQRAFVKCVAINWGLGLKLWEKPVDAAMEEGNLKDDIIKMCGNLIGPKFTDSDSLMEHIFGLPVGQKISEIKGKDKSIQFGKFLEIGSTEDKKSILQSLEALNGDDIF